MIPDTRSILGRNLLAALVVRFLLLILGSLIDSSDMQLKYTDIDYFIYSQASRYMWDGKSPYLQETFRYPPLLALLMLPNRHFVWFGKLLFLLADVYIIVVIDKILSTVNDLKFAGNISKEFRDWIGFLWAVNPFSSNIATRGSMDSLSNLMILSTLLMVKKEAHTFYL